MSNLLSDENLLQGDALGKMISLYLDNKITDKQLAQLRQTLETDESARDFYVEFIFVHAHLEQTLQHSFSIEGRKEVSDEKFLNRLLAEKSTSSTQYYLTRVGFPILLVMILSVWFGIHNFHQNSRVTVTEIHQEKASTSEQLVIGGRLEFNRSYQLQNGGIELLFSTGAKVFIAAPAHFKITKKNEINLSQGQLTAKVTTEKGKGFTVNTPSGAITDLGTFFGVEVDKKGASGVQVFEGQVELKNFWGRRIPLSSGEIMRCPEEKKHWQPTKKLTPEFYLAVQKNRQLLPAGTIFPGELGRGVSGRDAYVGTSYVMYSASRLRERFSAPEYGASFSGVAEYFAVVHFDQSSQAWHIHNNEQSIPFKPAATDLLIARIESIKQEDDTVKKNVTYFEKQQGTIQSIAYGYKRGDLSVRLNWFAGKKNDGDFILSGTYFIR